jgi:hypothetical protein
MLWILMSLVGCTSPPAIEAETSYVSDPCGTLSKQITMRSAPDSVVTLNRGGDTIAEYRTDAEGQTAVRWPSTSLDGVEAWVGNPNNHSTAILSDPPPTFEPVWQGVRVSHMQCLGVAGGCRLSVDGTDLVASSAGGVQLTVEGRSGTASADRKTSRVALSLGDVTGQMEDAEDGVERCRHTLIRNVGVRVGDVSVLGAVWLGEGQAIDLFERVTARDMEGANPAL